MVNFQDLNLSEQAISLMTDFNDEVILKEEALKLLGRLLQYRSERGYESSDLIEGMKRIWHS